MQQASLITKLRNSVTVDALFLILLGPLMRVGYAVHVACVGAF